MLEIQFELIRMKQFTLTLFVSLCFSPVLCFLKTGIRPMNGNFLPAFAAAAFLAAASALSGFFMFLTALGSFLSVRRSLDLEREKRSRRRSRRGLRL